MGALATLSVALICGDGGASAALQRAIDEVSNFEDARAREDLLKLLAQSPPRPIAGKAHLYLGLIALDAHDTETMLAEFEKALIDDPAMEIVRSASPKARMAFDEARRNVERRLAPEATPLPAAPAAAVEAPTPHSHTLGMTIGAVTIALLALTAVSIAEVVSYDGNYGGGLGSKGTATYNSGAYGTAQAFEITEFVAGGLAAAGVAGTVLTW